MRSTSQRCPTTAAISSALRAASESASVRSSTASRTVSGSGRPPSRRDVPRGRASPPAPRRRTECRVRARAAPRRGRRRAPRAPRLRPAARCRPRSNGRSGSSTGSHPRRICARRRRRRCVSAGTSSRAIATSSNGASRSAAARRGRSEQRRLVRPLEVVEHDGHRPARRQLAERAQQRLDERRLARVLRPATSISGRSGARYGASGPQASARSGTGGGTGAGPARRGRTAPPRTSAPLPCRPARRAPPSASATRRVLPIPASPVTSTQRPRPSLDRGARGLERLSLRLPADQSAGSRARHECRARKRASNGPGAAVRQSAPRALRQSLACGGAEPGLASVVRQYTEPRRTGMPLINVKFIEGVFDDEPEAPDHRASHRHAGRDRGREHAPGHVVRASRRSRAATGASQATRSRPSTSARWRPAPSDGRPSDARTAPAGSEERRRPGAAGTGDRRPEAAPERGVGRVETRAARDRSPRCPRPLAGRASPSACASPHPRRSVERVGGDRSRERDVTAAA